MVQERPIEGFPGYFVRDTGEVVSRRRALERVLRPVLGNHGYYSVNLAAKGRPGRMYLVHRLVAFAFIPNPLGKTQVNHRSAVRSDNSVSNLEWVTPQENSDHAVSTKLMAVGELQPTSVLSNWDAWRIPQWVEGGYSDSEIAKFLGCTRETIGKVRRGETWTHITGLPRWVREPRSAVA